MPIYSVRENAKGVITNGVNIERNQKDIEENKRAISDLKNNSVPYLVHESAMTRHDRIIHRLIAVVVVLIILLTITNAIWIYAWNTWDNDATTVFNKDGTTNFIGKDGDINANEGVLQEQDNGTNNAD